MPHDVFISYSIDDKPIADAMCATLESKGIRCWIAPRDILPGMDWGGSIIDAITTSRVMVLLLSSNSNTSAQVRREVERAVNKEVIILPFRIENISLSKPLEYHLSSTHWMDASTPPIENHLQMLAEKVRQLLPADTRPGNLPLQNMENISVQSLPASRKRSAVYLGTALIVGLIVLGGLVWLLSRNNQTTESTTTAPTPTAPASTPKGEASNVKDKVAANQNQSANNNAEPGVNGPLAVPKIYEKTYDVARKLLIKEGWQPNLRHVSQGDDPDVQSGNGPIFWNRGYWELVSCSGTSTAECLFEFIDPNGRVLVVVTTGEEDERGSYHATVSRATFKKQ